MKKILFLSAFVVLALTLNRVKAQQLVVYNSVPGRSASDHYLCRVKFESENNSAFRDAFVLQTTCKTGPGYYSNLYGWSASWIAFESDFKGDKVIVEISKKDGSEITKAMVRPVAKASPATIINGKAYITIDKPTNINVDINGQMEDQYTGMEYTGNPIHTISIFANPVYPVPDASDPRVIQLNPGDPIPADRSLWHTIYFKPGVHDIGNSFEILSNETLYIPGNAVVHGTIHPPKLWGASSAQNIKVYGSGAISGENNVWNGDTEIANKTFTNQAASAILEGFVVIDPANHTFNMNCSYGDTLHRNIYKNLKIFGWRPNSDAINAFRHSVITDCFFRTQDDDFYYGEDVKISNITTWNDANGSVLFLTKGSPVMTDSYFKDITVIYHRAKWHYWTGGRIISMRETPPGRTIQNVAIQNVLVEDPYPAFPPFYATMLSGTGDVILNNIVIANVRQEHEGVSCNQDQTRGKPRNTLFGLDNSRKWKNITFKDCYYNGKMLTSFADGKFDTTFVDNNTVIFQVTPAIAVDTISNVTSPNKVSPNETITVTVGYETSQSRDVRVFVQQNSAPWTTYGSKTVTVAAGKRTENVDLIVSSGIPLAVDAYKIVVDLLPIGGAWPDRLDEYTKTGIDAIRNCSNDFPWSSSDFVVSNNVVNYTSGIIDISCASVASFSLDIEGIVQANVGLNYCNVYYKVDGGIPQVLSENSGAFALKTVSVKGIVGNTLEIMINADSGDIRNKYSAFNLTASTGGLIANSKPSPDFDKQNKTGVIRLYPIPIHNMVCIDFCNSDLRTISVYSMTGKLLYSTQSSEQSLSIDVRSLRVSGIIFIKVQSGQSVSNHKMLVV